MTNHGSCVLSANVTLVKATHTDSSIKVLENLLLNVLESIMGGNKCATLALMQYANYKVKG